MSRLGLHRRTIHRRIAGLSECMVSYFYTDNDIFLISRCSIQCRGAPEFNKDISTGAL